MDRGDGRKKRRGPPRNRFSGYFRIEDEWLAIRTQVFAEIIDPDSLRGHSLPHRKNPVLIGVVNVHGDIQLCVSLSELLGIENAVKKDWKDQKLMMVVNTDAGRWVFPVNEILGIYHVYPHIFQNVPVTVAKAQSTYTKGIFNWKDKHVAFLDDDLLFYSLIRNVQ